MTTETKTCNRFGAKGQITSLFAVLFVTISIFEAIVSIVGWLVNGDLVRTWRKQWWFDRGTNPVFIRKAWEQTKTSQCQCCCMRSNRRPAEYKSIALPLHQQALSNYVSFYYTVVFMTHPTCNGCLLSLASTRRQKPLTNFFQHSDTHMNYLVTPF